MANALGGVIIATGAQGLQITGTGTCRVAPKSS